MSSHTRAGATPGGAPPAAPGGERRWLVPRPRTAVSWVDMETLCVALDCIARAARRGEVLGEVSRETDTEREDEDFDRHFDAAVRDAMAEHGT